MMKTMFLHGTLEICEQKNSNSFKVNSQQLKPFLEFEHDA